MTPLAPARQAQLRWELEQVQRSGSQERLAAWHGALTPVEQAYVSHVCRATLAAYLRTGTAPAWEYPDQPTTA